MRKYIEVAKVLFRAQLVYRFDVAMTAVATMSRIVCAWILWGAIFNGRNEVAGFDFQSMLSYYVVISLLGSIDLSYGVIEEVSARIRGGTFSRFMTIPANPLRYFIAQTLGAASYYALFGGAAAILCTLLLGINLVPAQGPGAVLCAVVMIPIGLVFMICYQYTMGLLALKFGDVGIIRHIQGEILAFAMGTIVPLALLPTWAVRALGFLPFPHVQATPVLLLMGRMSAAQGIGPLLILCLWTLAMMMIAGATYERLRVRYDGVGI